MNKSINPVVAYEYLIGNQIYLGGPEIKKLFGVKSSKTVQKIKKPIQEIMHDKKMPLNHGRVVLKILYEYYGLEEKDLEHKYMKIKKYGIKIGGTD